MRNHLQNCLCLAWLLAAFAVLFCVGNLQAEDEVLQTAAQHLAELETQLEGLRERVGSDHPRVQGVEEKIRALQAELDHRTRELQPRKQREALQRERRERENHLTGREERDLQSRVRRRHVRDAIEHLHAADLDDLADLIGDQVRNRIRDREHGDERGVNRERRHDFGDENTRGTNNERVISRLAQAIQQLERRVRDLDEIQRAVEDTHRNAEHMHREFELRLREVEQVAKHHFRDTQRFVEERSGELEKVIEDVERRIGELEEHLHELTEHVEQDSDHEADPDHQHHREHDADD